MTMNITEGTRFRTDSASPWGGPDGVRHTERRIAICRVTAVIEARGKGSFKGSDAGAVQYIVETIESNDDPMPIEGVGPLDTSRWPNGGIAKWAITSGIVRFEILS